MGRDYLETYSTCWFYGVGVVSFVRSVERSMLPQLQKSKLGFIAEEELFQQCSWLCH